MIGDLRPLPIHAGAGFVAGSFHGVTTSLMEISPFKSIGLTMLRASLPPNMIHRAVAHLLASIACCKSLPRTVGYGNGSADRYDNKGEGNNKMEQSSMGISSISTTDYCCVSAERYWIRSIRVRRRLQHSDDVNQVWEVDVQHSTNFFCVIYSKVPSLVHLECLSNEESCISLRLP